MGKVRFEWNMAAFREIRTSQPVMAELNAYAESKASAHPGFIAHPAKATGGRVRGRAAVVTGTVEAMLHEARYHVLSGGEKVRYVSKAGRVSYITQKQADNYNRGKRG